MNLLSTAILIGSSKPELEKLCSHLTLHFPNLKIIGQFESIVEIPLLKSDIIIIDPDNCGTGAFEFLQTIDINNTEIIVVSEISEKLIYKSSNIRALPLWKPYTEEQFKKTIQNALNMLARKKMNEQQLRFAIIRENLRNSKIGIGDSSNIIFVESKNILWCESNDGSLTFYLSKFIQGCKNIENGNYFAITSSKSIGEWEKKLEPKGIVRIHNRYLVNLEYIEKYLRTVSPSVLLAGGKELSVSDKYKTNLLSILPEN